MFSNVKEKLRELAISPIFFVGSGLSRRYIDSPDWIGLLEESVKDIDCNFKKVKQKYTHINPSTNKKEINFEGLAEYLESFYFEHMKDEIEDDKTQAYYYRKRISQIISGYLENKKNTLLSNKEVLELKKTSPAAIITTNYDEMLETIYGDEYSVHIGQNSLLTNVLDGIGEIYKIHGCVTVSESIVITKDDYDNFFKKSVYLNSKLLTLFLEYPIVFLGYSINDRNVISILSTIYETLPNTKVKELESRMWFVTRPDDGKDKVVHNKRINLNNGAYMEIDAFELNDFGDFYRAINDISIKRLPIRFLKYLKHNTYELIATQKYNPKLLSVNVEQIEKIKDFNEGNNFVGLSFSTQEKKVFSSSSEIINAFIEGDSTFDPLSVLGVLHEHGSANLPLYKFIKDLKGKEIVEEVEKRFGRNSRLFRRIIKDNSDYSVNIGVKKKRICYVGEINSESVQRYLEKYREKNCLHRNQDNVIRRYIILYLLNNRINDLLESENFIKKYKKEITKVATNLHEQYIMQKHSEIISLIEKLYNDNNTGEFKRLLCLVDRVVYRNEIGGLEDIEQEYELLGE